MIKTKLGYCIVFYFEVMHFFFVQMYAMILKVNLIKLIGDLRILVLITSCICHDLDHPGYNNIYQVINRTVL